MLQSARRRPRLVGAHSNGRRPDQDEEHQGIATLWRRVLVKSARRWSMVFLPAARRAACIPSALECGAERSAFRCRRSGRRVRSAYKRGLRRTGFHGRSSAASKALRSKSSESARPTAPQLEHGLSRRRCSKGKWRARPHRRTRRPPRHCASPGASRDKNASTRSAARRRLCAGKCVQSPSVSNPSATSSASLDRASDSATIADNNLVEEDRRW